MIDLSLLRQNTFHLLGYGVSNRGAAQALKAAGKKVVVWDDAPDKRDAARKDGFEVTNAITSETLVVSPGIIAFGEKAHALIKEAQQRNIPINNDIGLFRSMAPNKKLIAITGTNGKSTTTALIHHILQQAGVKSEVGGNLGTPALTLDANADVYVLELSSYQLETAPFLKPDVAILLNVTPDHLDHHGTMENYIAAKMRLFNGAAHTITGDTLNYKEGMYAGHDLRQFDRLRGEHNWQNIAAAFEACTLYGLSSDQIWQGVETYPGLPHRQYQVRDIGNVIYVNDSKATNADATQKALRSFDNIYLIAGGLPKEGGLNGLENDLSGIKKVYLIGQAQHDFAAWLSAHDVTHEICDEMENAVTHAHKDAQNDGEKAVVLLSPACASWDQYPNFEERGKHFERLVNAL